MTDLNIFIIKSKNNEDDDQEVTRVFCSKLDPKKVEKIFEKKEDKLLGTISLDAQDIDTTCLLFGVDYFPAYDDDEIFEYAMQMVGNHIYSPFLGSIYDAMFTKLLDWALSKKEEK